MATRHTEQKYLKLLQRTMAISPLADATGAGGVLFCTRRHGGQSVASDAGGKSGSSGNHRPDVGIAPGCLRYKPEQLLSERRSSYWSLVMLIQAIQLLGKISTR